jgi:two-component system, chemotaxis family, sensor kinase CheA
MAVRTTAELMDALAAAVVEADADEATTLAEVLKALEAARAGNALIGPLAAEAAELASELQAPDLSAEALKRLSQLLGEAQVAAARPSAPRADLSGAASARRDAETVELIGDFLEESGEGLSRADEILLAIEQGEADHEKINALFRVFHTIKGVAGFLELSEIVSLAHITETLLNLVREEKFVLEGTTFDVVFESTARLRSLLAALRRAVDSRSDLLPDPAVPGLVKRIGDVIEAGPQDPSARAEKAEFVTKKGPADAEGKPSYVIRKAADPAGGAQKGLPLTPAPPPPEAPPFASESVASGPKLTPAAPAAPALAAEAARAAPASAAPKAAAPASAQGGEQGGGSTQLRETVKVDLERVDSMVEMIGELIIVESMVVHAPEVAALTSLKVRNYLNQLTKISRDLQNVAMRMRMVPVRGAFQKMARMVRDLARKTGKDIILEQAGEETEMDRSMVERIEDPLVHLVRNSIDHGIEAGVDRASAGKSARAVIKLSAYHEGGSIVVELSDDGRGLQRDRILAKAREKGLVEQDRELTDAEIYNLIFLPGFSTAAKVTEISGRGVGMDVVKRNIEGMRGRVSVASRPGLGTSFKMVLPLTLAIIDGMLVACGTEKYIIPSLSIIESLRPTADMVSLAAGRGEVINVRGEILPLLRLHRLLQMQGQERPPTDSHVVVLEGLGRKLGIVVDDVLTQQQVVIKPLGQGIGDTDYLSGAAILSDGRVGLILNVDRLSSLAAQSARPARREAVEV